MTNLLNLGEQLAKQNPELLPTKTSLSEVFAEIIFSARVRAGLTQVKLAENASVTPKTIHRIEGGSGGITDTTYQKVFNALDIEISDLAEVFKKKSESLKKELVTV